MGVQQTFGGTARVLFPILAGFAFDRFPSLPFLVSASARGGHDSAGAGYGGVHPAKARTRGRAGGLSLGRTRSTFSGGWHARSSTFAVRFSLFSALSRSPRCGRRKLASRQGARDVTAVTGHRLRKRASRVRSELRWRSPLVVQRHSRAERRSRARRSTFAVTRGSATVTPASVATDATGQAKAQVTLGSSPGHVTITATVAGTSLTATFVETAGASTITRGMPDRFADDAGGGEVRRRCVRDRYLPRRRRDRRGLRARRVQREHR